MTSTWLMSPVSPDRGCGDHRIAARIGQMAEQFAAMDRIDREILRILRDDGRIGWSELGARVHLSANATAERVRRLRRAGVIRRFTVEVDQESLGRTLEAVIEVKVAPGNRFHDVLVEC